LTVEGASAAMKRDAPIEVQSTTGLVYEALRERILSGRVAPDERLHQEAISAELGVSRTPLREALGRLAADGLVELLPNRGARVADPSPEDMLAGYEARLAVEPDAAAYCAERADGAAIAAVRHAIDIQRRPGRVERRYRANRDFHLAVVRGSGNPYLVRFAELLWVGRLGLRIYTLQLQSEEGAAADADEHEAIADAIEAGDPVAAERRMREHIEAAIARFR
jgi:DNA-binding GntR family transcriptional regulator